MTALVSSGRPPPRIRRPFLQRRGSFMASRRSFRAPLMWVAARAGVRHTPQKRWPAGQQDYLVAFPIAGRAAAAGQPLRLGRSRSPRCTGCGRRWSSKSPTLPGRRTACCRRCRIKANARPRWRAPLHCRRRPTGAAKESRKKSTAACPTSLWMAARSTPAASMQASGNSPLPSSLHSLTKIL